MNDGDIWDKETDWNLAIETLDQVTDATAFDVYCEDIRVWMRKSDGQLGEGMIDVPFLGTIWIYGHYDDGQDLVPGPCLFLADGDAKESDFIDLGPL